MDMCSQEELEYDEKLEQVTDLMKEFVLDIMIESLQNIKRSHEHFVELRRSREPDCPPF